MEEDTRLAILQQPLFNQVQALSLAHQILDHVAAIRRSHPVDVAP